MKVTPEVLCYEFIGTEAKVAKNKNRDCVGIRGKIVDETRNTFTILQEAEKKQIIKESSVFFFKFSDGTLIEIDGKLLVGRPEDRIKKRIKRLW